MTSSTAPMAAAGAASLRGRWLMPCRALSSLREWVPGLESRCGVVMTGPASSKVTGLSGSATGSGGTGGTTAFPGSVRRTVVGAATREALSG